MNSLFSWVPWFQELAQKIAADGAESLIARTKEIPWNKDGSKSRLLQYGDQNIDPLSFFYVLASKNGMTRVYSAITEVFDLAAQVNFEGGFYYPTPQARAKLLFHSGGRGNSDLLWRLFRSAVAGFDSIKGHEFDEALSIKNVGVSKLTEALFLINPGEFLPFDKQSLIPLQQKLDRANQVNNWDTYRQEVEAVRGVFPGCEPYEIQHFAYEVFGTRELDVKDGRVWRGSTTVGKNEPDGWNDFRENGRIHYQEPPKLPYALRHPNSGDIVLVHTGLFDCRGIAVVRHNDHKDRPTAEQRLHVLWLNTSPASVDGVLSGERFSGAKKTLSTFQSVTQYKPTFDLLEKLRLSSGERQRNLGARAPDFQALKDDTLISEASLEEIWKLLEDKKQIIFQGPPGTGKTYLARKLAKYLAGSKGRTKLVQFHPSYAYEDFVEGYRPTLQDGHAGFARRHGPLREMAELARESDEKHFLVIDEINRGNLSKVLGECYFLLEYRDEDIRLQYSNEVFSLPPNLYIIGTMNTADRSIALVDLALRRRFHFVDFHPDKTPIKGLLRRWLDKHAPNMLWVVQVVERANQKLDDRHAAIGPSYFMREGLNEPMVQMIWKHNVLPYIEERLFGQEDVLKRFDLDRLRKEAEGQPSQAEGETTDASGTGESDHEAD